MNPRSRPFTASHRLPASRLFRSRSCKTFRGVTDTVLGEALKQLRQEYASAGKTSTLEALLTTA